MVLSDRITAVCIRNEISSAVKSHFIINCEQQNIFNVRIANLYVYVSIALLETAGKLSPYNSQ